MLCANDVPVERARAGTRRARLTVVKRSVHRIAIHEAGHAVMAYLCGRRIGAASALPRRGSLGHLEYGGLTSYPVGWLEDARTRRKLEDEIMIALAGLAAEYVQPGVIDHAGAAADLARALEIALPAAGNPEEATAFINWLFVRARSKLADRRSRQAITDLATALERRGSLTGTEIRARLRRSLH